MSWLLIIFVVSIALYIFTTWRKNNHKAPLPPGPSLLESFKIIWGIITRNDIHIVGEKLALRFGEILIIRFGGLNIVFVNSARLLRKLLTNAKYRDITNDRPPSFLRDHVVYGGKDIIFSDYNEYQTNLRKLLHGVVQLYGEGVQDFENMVNTEIENLQKKLMVVKTGQSFDMDDALKISVIRTLHLFLTNEALKEDVQAEFCSIVENYDKGFTNIARVDTNMALTLIPWLRHLPGSYGELVQELQKYQNKLIDFLLNPSKRKKWRQNGKSLLGTLLAEQETNDQITEESVKGVIIDTVVAGFVTTSGFLGGFFLLMLHHPDIQRRIQEELDKVLAGRQPSLGERSSLHYTNAAILECLRYIRHVPHGAAHMNREEIEIEGYRIPAKSTIITNLWSMAKDEQQWDNPDVFNPDRFLDEDRKFVPVTHQLRQQLMPFGVGRRICVGESFAKSRIFLYVTSLLQKFNFRPDGNPLAPEDSKLWTLNAAMHPPFLKCIIEQRKQPD
ncbi:cytochrome P450 2C31-like [Patella vulgata]|uniref:cytochrome P450 2C31-like n=1 Tax=Patella vulgata TaxID=6465 RepID=UPI0024A934F3|nr:cytochrome P450 2C31-like [Patella vulgata]